MEKGIVWIEKDNVYCNKIYIHRTKAVAEGYRHPNAKPYYEKFISGTWVYEPC